MDGSKEGLEPWYVNIICWYFSDWLFSTGITIKTGLQQFCLHLSCYNVKMSVPGSCGELLTVATCTHTNTHTHKVILSFVFCLLTINAATVIQQSSLNIYKQQCLDFNSLGEKMAEFWKIKQHFWHHDDAWTRLENTHTWKISYLRLRCLWEPDVCVDGPGGHGHLSPVKCQHSQRAHSAHTHPRAMHIHAPCLKTEKSKFLLLPQQFKVKANLLLKICFN